VSGEPLSLAVIDEIEARANDATPGPWIPQHQHFPTSEDATKALLANFSRGVEDRRVCWISPAPNPTLISIAVTGWGPRTPANTVFIAHARDDIPLLIAEIRRLQRREVEARGIIESALASDAELRTEIERLKKLAEHSSPCMWPSCPCLNPKEPIR